MNIDDLLDNAKNLTDYEFEQKLNKLVRENSSFHNLDEKNKEVVMDLYKKFKPYLRKGIGISSRRIQNESYKLWKDRNELGLTEEDLKDIKNIMRGFQGKKSRKANSIFSWLGF